MGKTIISLALAAAFAIPSFAQDIISMKNGTREEANVLEIDETTVRYKKFNNPEGPTYSVKKESVSEITYKNGTKENFDKKSQELSPEKNPNSVWWTKAKETKLGFWMDPLGFAQWGPMVGVSIRVGSNFDIKGHLRIYTDGFPLTDKFTDIHQGIGFGLEFSKLFITSHGNWHAGILVETSHAEGEYSQSIGVNGSYNEDGKTKTIHSHGYLDVGVIKHDFALTGGYTLRFKNSFFVDFELQSGCSLYHFESNMDYHETYFYADASVKLGYEF